MSFYCWELTSGMCLSRRCPALGRYVTIFTSTIWVEHELFLVVLHNNWHKIQKGPPKNHHTVLWSKDKILKGNEGKFVHMFKYHVEGWRYILDVTIRCKCAISITLLPLYPQHPSDTGTRGSVFGWGTMLQAGRSRVRFLMRLLDFSFDLILAATLWPWGRLNLKQKWVPGIFGG
jgi:hypothetical protein